MRKYGRVDDNQSAIVEGLRTLGCSVRNLSAVGGGCPDLLVGRAGINYLLEVKDENKYPSERKLTKDQREFFAAWNGQAVVVKNIEEARRAVGL